MAQHHNGAQEITHSYDQAPAPWDYSMLRVPLVYAVYIVGQSVQ